MEFKTIDEWKAQASKEAIEQFEKPILWFSENVKCCYNCKYWAVDTTLMYEYKYNYCKKSIEFNKEGFMSPNDAYCKHYKGNAEEKNLLDYTCLDDYFESEVTEND